VISRGLSHLREITDAFTEDLVTNSAEIRFSYTEAVYRAQGVVSVQAACTLDTAFALMQNTVEAADETIEYVAELVMMGQVRFYPPT